MDSNSRLECHPLPNHPMRRVVQTRKPLVLLASAAKEEAQQARAQKAEKKAAEYARNIADYL